jgi:hypothetical protein
MSTTENQQANGADEARAMVHVKLTRLFHVTSDAAANALAAVNWAAITDYTARGLDTLAREVADSLPHTAFEQDSPERTRHYLRELRAKLVKEREREAAGGTKELDARLARRGGGSDFDLRVGHRIP